MSEQQSSQNKRGEVLEFAASSSIEHQAQEWMIRLDDQPTPDDLQHFKRWVNQSKAHQSAFEEVVAFSAEMDVLSQIVLPREQMASRSGLFASLFAWTQFRWMAMACSGLLIAFVVTMLPPTDSGQYYVSAIGEQRRIALADGSSVLLNTNSEVRVDYLPDRRQLTLLRGEAHFDVNHDPARPFEVSAGKGLVRALGTAFTVHLRRRDVGVIVTEGRVEIARADSVAASAPPESGAPPTEASPSADKTTAPALPPPVQVKAGNQLVYDRESSATLERAEVAPGDGQLSWHKGDLVFDGETLAAVVEEVSRYTVIKIRIPEAKARQIKIGGVFKVGDTEAFFEALERGFGIRVDKTVPGKVVDLYLDKQDAEKK